MQFTELLEAAKIVYSLGPNRMGFKTTSLFTSTTTTTTTMVVTAAAGAESSSFTTSERKRPSHRKKPLSSFDNDTEADVTLRTVFNNYGVSQEYIGFILDASYCLIVTGMLLLWYIFPSHFLF